MPAGITASTALWYASRATGVVALLLLSAVMILGMLVSRSGRLPGLPRFGVTTLHRNLALLSVAFVAVHVITAIADPYVTIGIAAAIFPFTSRYETWWLGLGAVSIDVIIALIVTSLARARIGRRAWRAVHWLAYLSWPVAFAHSLGSSPDLRHGGLVYLAIGSALAVGAALTWRMATSAAARRRALGSAAPGPARRDWAALARPAAPPGARSPRRRTPPAPPAALPGARSLRQEARR
jgi:methionine sulfoxide reductase heme-binding subunit